MSFFPLRIHQNRCQLGLRPRPHRGSLQRSPDSLAGFKGPLRGRRGIQRREGLGEGKEGKGGEKAEVGGIASWLLGIDAPASSM